jgi:hypothetical protein
VIVAHSLTLVRLCRMTQDLRGKVNGARNMWPIILCNSVGNIFRSDKYSVIFSRGTSPVESRVILVNQKLEYVNGLQLDLGCENPFIVLEMCYLRAERQGDMVKLIVTYLQKLTVTYKLKKKTKLRDFSPQANYTDRATDACRRS